MRFDAAGMPVLAAGMPAREIVGESDEFPSTRVEEWRLGRTTLFSTRVGDGVTNDGVTTRGVEDKRVRPQHYLTGQQGLRGARGQGPQAEPDGRR